MDFMDSFTFFLKNYPYNLYNPGSYIPLLRNLLIPLQRRGTP